MSVSSDECHGRNFLFDFFPCSRQFQFHGPTAAAFRSHVFCWRPLSIFVVCFSFCCHWWNSWLGRVTTETIRLICLWTCPGTVSTPACPFVYNGAACSAFSGTQNPLQACAGRLFTAKRQTQRTADYSPNFIKENCIYFSNPKNILFIAFQQGHSTCFFHMKHTVRVSKFPFVVKFIIPDARIVLRPPCFVKFISCSDAYLSVFKFFFSFIQSARRSAGDAFIEFFVFNFNVTWHFERTSNKKFGKKKRKLFLNSGPLATVSADIKETAMTRNRRKQIMQRQMKNEATFPSSDGAATGNGGSRRRVCGAARSTQLSSKFGRWKCYVHCGFWAAYANKNRNPLSGSSLPKFFFFELFKSTTLYLTTSWSGF